MATILGSFTGKSTSIARPYIEYSYTQDIPNNQSTITASLYFVKYNASYFFFNTGGFTNNFKIDTSTSSTTETFDLRSSSVPEIELIVTRSYTVTHNSDGTRSVWIGASGNTGITALGTYDFGSTVTLPTIPREATITNSVSFTVENDIPLTFSNPANYWIKCELYVNGALIKSQNFGQVTSGTLTLDATNDAAIYAQMPSVTSTSMYVRCKTYTTSGYTTQLGSNKDKTGTASINQSINLPTFLDWDLTAVDKAVAVKDKYDNTLVTSQTNTLTGSASKIIKGFNTTRATIEVADKAVAKNSATMATYALTAGSLTGSAAYSAVAAVNVTLQDVLVNSMGVKATDSRGLSTTVTKAFSNMANYAAITLTTPTLTRDNNVDAPTKLAFSGTAFDGYFGGGVAGVQNTVTAHYRYKESTVAWGAQTWNAITVTFTGGSFTFDDYVNGDLGASGFDTSKSFDIEVRVYDKLTATITEEPLSKGIPLVHYTTSGVAIKGAYDTAEGGAWQVHGATRLNGDVTGDGVLDEDDMASNSAVKIATQQSIKAYVDNRLAFFAYISANQNITATFVTVNANTELYDTGGAYDNSTYRFVAPIAGYYHFFGELEVSSAAGDRLLLALFKNGAEERRGNGHITTSSSLYNVSVSADIYLAANDYVDLRAASSTTRSTANANNKQINYFGGHLVQRA
jgi:hypothetical protein